MSGEDATFKSWCIVELMGHQRMAGLVTEAIIAGTPMLRVDVPEAAGRAAYTRYLGGQAVYALNPCEESLARRMAEACHSPPVQRYELQLPGPVHAEPTDGNEVF